MNLYLQDFLQFTAWALPLWATIVLHGVARAYAASVCGDTTSLTQGRVSLHPRKNSDLLGSFIIPALMWLAQGQVFGWSPEVTVSKKMLRHPNFMMLIALIGLFSSLLQVIVWMSLQHYWHVLPLPKMLWLDTMMHNGIYMNISFFLLHSIPVPPMDAYYFLESILPKRLYYYYSKCNALGLAALAYMVWFGHFSGFQQSVSTHIAFSLEYILRHWIWL